MKAKTVNQRSRLEQGDPPPAVGDSASVLSIPATTQSGGTVATRDVFPGLARFRQEQQESETARRIDQLPEQEASDARRILKAQILENARSLREKARARLRTIFLSD